MMKLKFALMMLALIACIIANPVAAQQPAADLEKALAVEWQALIGAMQAQNSAAGHVQQQIQALMTASDSGKKAITELAATKAYWAAYVGQPISPAPPASKP